MQVLDVKDAASSVTLGAKKSTEFKMTLDPALMLALSINLYTNPKLAVAREVLCNANDTHIEAGVTDKPIRITITADNDLIIQDFGYGIPHDKLPEIYGTYGESTKADDSKTTGGFGLGCKTPFAVADSFRVVNERDGIKSVWQMVKADVNQDGKPSITPVMEVPTEGRGLTVSMRLPTSEVRHMITYIRYVVMHGEMNAELKLGLNEFEKLPVIGMSQEPGSFTLNDSWYHPYMGNHSIFIRYGAVIYPMLDNPSTEKQVSLIKDFMSMVGYNRLLVQAAPDTLVLSPSREALSSTPKTVNGLTDICVNLVRNMEEDLIAKIPDAVKALRKKLENPSWLLGNYSDCRYFNLKPSSLYSHLEPDYLVRYLKSPIGRKWTDSIEPKLQQSFQHGFNKSLEMKTPGATKAIKKLGKQCHQDGESFVKKFIFKRLAKSFIGSQTVKLDRLRLFCTPHYGRYVDRYDKKFVYHLTHRAFHSIQTMKILVDNPTILLSTFIKDVDDSAKCYFKVTGHPFWVYHLKPKDNIDAITKHFESINYTVVDLTANHEWDLPAQERLKAKAKRAKSKTVVAAKPVVRKTSTLVPMSALLNFNKVGDKYWSFDFTGKEGTVIDNPTWFIDSNALSYNGFLSKLCHVKDLSEDMLNQTVVVRTGVERNMAIKRGAVSLEPVLAKQLFDVVTSKEYADYMTLYRQRSIQDFAITSSDLKFLRRLNIKLTGYDKMFHSPRLERFKAILCSHKAYAIQTMLDLTTEQIEAFNEAKKLKLTRLPFMEKLGTLYRDPILSRFEGLDDISAFMDQHPERANALKSLVLSALKTGTKPK